MKRNLGNKGFTLVELLAVIVILALIMVFSVPRVLDTSNAAKRKTFILYSQEVITAAQEYVELQKMLGNTPKTLLEPSDIGYKTTNNYRFCLIYTPDDLTTTNNEEDYTIHISLKDNTLCFSGDVDTLTVGKDDTPLSSNCTNVGNVSGNTCQ